MKLSIGIVGLPNVGKSTLFKALTNQNITIANYPFATIDPNVGIVSVPDERLQKLSALSKSKKTIPAVIEFYDIAGLVRGANEGEGLGNQFLSHIRETNIVVQVVRCFGGTEIIHVEQDGVNPVRDIEIINTELILKDLALVEKMHDKAVREAKIGDKKKIEEAEVIKQVHDALSNNKLVCSLGEEVLNYPAVREMNLLTAKKQIFLLNGKESDVPQEVFDVIAAQGAGYVIMDLSGAVNLDPLIKKAYETLGLISFFTTGEDETRAWTTVRGAKAPQAAGAIHTDFERLFIRAEVVSSEKLLELGGWTQAKQKGQLRVEGKDYVVQDGDVMVIRHG